MSQGNAAEPTNGTTAADIAEITGSRIVTALDLDTPLIAAVLDAAAAMQKVALTGAVVVVEWSPLHPNGPLPDLIPVLDRLLAKGPAAVLVSPTRAVNPPPQVVAGAKRAGVTLVWNTTGTSPSVVAAQIGGLLALSKRSMAATYAVPDALLSVADDLQRLLGALADELGCDVHLSLDPGGHARPAPSGLAVTSVRLSTSAVGGPTLDVYRSTALTVVELRMLDVLTPILRLHVALVESIADDSAVERARNLKHVLGDDLVQRETSLRKARRLSMFPQHAVVCLGIEPFGVRVDLEGLHQLRDAMTPVATRFDPDSIVVVNAGTVVIVIRATTELDSFVRALYRSVQVPLAVGVSDEVNDPRSYPSSYRQAERAVAVGRRVGAINRVTRYRDLGVLGVLYQLPEHTRRNFVAETLGSVGGSSGESQDQRKILRTLRETDCNIAESARALFVHPNTLRSRIARIEQITGPFMSEPERRMTIFTALAMFSLDSSESE